MFVYYKWNLLNETVKEEKLIGYNKKRFSVYEHYKCRLFLPRLKYIIC